MSRIRRTIAALLAAGLSLALAACGGSGNGESAAAITPPTAAAAPSSARAFPVTIEHAYGSTTIAAPPRRVLALGYQELDPILALGVVPVAARYWFGDENDVVRPWADAAAGATPVKVLNMPDGISIERVAAMRPDLIMAVNADLDTGVYAKLSRIAPTVARPAQYNDFGTPWQEQTEITGQALGRGEQARTLIAAVEARLAQARLAHPEFEGRQVAVAHFSEDGLSALPSQDARPRFFAALGFTTPAEYDRLAGDDFLASISKERAGLLDVDLLVWDQLAFVEGGRAKVESDPVVSRLAAMREKRVLYLEGDLGDAFAYNSVLSLPFVLSELLPQISAALENASPATTGAS
ncbi:MAG: iron-siderophore ABC transporter substrate-binding protein [Sporichthyaceae bacterium]